MIIFEPPAVAPTKFMLIYSSSDFPGHNDMLKNCKHTLKSKLSMREFPPGIWVKKKSVPIIAY